MYLRFSFFHDLSPLLKMMPRMKVFLLICTYIMVLQAEEVYKAVNWELAAQLTPIEASSVPRGCTCAEEAGTYVVRSVVTRYYLTEYPPDTQSVKCLIVRVYVTLWQENVILIAAVIPNVVRNISRMRPTMNFVYPKATRNPPSSTAPTQPRLSL